MSYYLTNLVLFLFIIYFYKTNRKGLHIFQLEHYYQDRYAKWLRDNTNQTFNFNNLALLFISSAILAFNVKIGYLVMILTYLVLIFSVKKS